MVYKTPRDLVYVTTNAALVKAGMRWDQILVLAFQAGVFIAFGSILATVICASDDYETFTHWPGLKSLIFGAVFPVGLLAVVIVGGELFTSNTAYMVPAYLQGTISLYDLLRNYTLSYFGNFIGAVFAAYFLAYAPDLFEKEPYRHFAIAVAEKKMHHTWFAAFCRAVGCNYLVCVAVWQSLASDDIASKILAIWFPTMAFVALGYEHCVANMYFCTIGIMLGSEKTYWDFIVDNLIPVTLGNIVGGAGFIAGLYYYVYMYVPPWLAADSENTSAENHSELIGGQPGQSAHENKASNGTARPPTSSSMKSQAATAKYITQNWSEVDGTSNKVELIPFHRDSSGNFSAGDLKQWAARSSSQNQGNNVPHMSTQSLQSPEDLCI